MSAAATIRRLAIGIQARLDELCRAADAPTEVLGLLDGLAIVNDYVEHNEQGLAFEHLIYMITEPGLVLSSTELRELAAVGLQLGFAERLWSGIRTA